MALPRVSAPVTALRGNPAAHRKSPGLHQPYKMKFNSPAKPQRRKDAKGKMPAIAKSLHLCQRDAYLHSRFSLRLCAFAVIAFGFQ
jgi:hypothetical protein